MEDDSVLAGLAPAEIGERVAQRAARTGRPCFAEQFIEGREFNLALLAGEKRGQAPFVRSTRRAVPAKGACPLFLPELLPPAEIEFSAYPPDKPRIVGHRAKWQSDSFEYHNTPRRFDFAAADEPLLDELRDLARQCWSLFRLRGWARVDFRVDAAGKPWILEVNANPCLSPDAGFAAALQQASIPYDEAIQRILEDVA
jgi:D-alanine-D-alanine ligase